MPSKEMIKAFAHHVIEGNNVEYMMFKAKKYKVIISFEEVKDLFVDEQIKASSQKWAEFIQNKNWYVREEFEMDIDEDKIAVISPESNNWAILDSYKAWKEQNETWIDKEGDIYFPIEIYAEFLPKKLKISASNRYIVDNLSSKHIDYEDEDCGYLHNEMIKTIYESGD